MDVRKGCQEVSRLIGQVPWEPVGAPSKLRQRKP